MVNRLVPDAHDGRKNSALTAADFQALIAEVQILDQLPRIARTPAGFSDADHRPAPGAGRWIAGLEPGQRDHVHLAGHGNGVALDVAGPPVSGEESAQVAVQD